MSALGRHVEEYLALRRSLGFKLEREEQLLAHFVAYSEAAGEQHLTSDLAIAWAKLPVAASPNQWAKRLGVVRRFAVYLVTMDPATEVPPSGIFPTNRRRPSPYLFSESDIERVLAAARGLAPALRAATHEALFGLLAASGMRIGEAISLARGDVDLESGVITIRHAKFDRTRLVPLHESTTAALSVYAATRDRLCRQPRADVFFCSSVGTTLDRSGVDKTVPRDHDGARTSHRDDTPARARSPARFCRPHARQLAAAGSEHRPPPRDTLGLSRARRAVRHLLVSVGRPRADDTRGRSTRRFGNQR
jgi:integrase/recombinase XerD